MLIKVTTGYTNIETNWLFSCSLQSILKGQIVVHLQRAGPSSLHVTEIMSYVQNKPR